MNWEDKSDSQSQEVLRLCIFGSWLNQFLPNSVIFCEVRLSLFIFAFIPILVSAQVVNVAGSVSEGGGDALPLAHIVILPDSSTTVSNKKGLFTISVSAGRKVALISYTGYDTQEIKFVAESDTTLNVILEEKVSHLDEVIVRSDEDRLSNLVRSTKLGSNRLSRDEIESIPVLGGEADPIKVLQLMPGTLRGIEGSSDLFVRGGAADQNLVLLDGAPIYNTSHLLGFVSVFNPDLLESVESVNGGFPADVGGRLSSMLDVKTKSTVAPQVAASGDIGLIASRFFVESPVMKDKVGVWVGGRRTYIDRVAKVVGEEIPYFFYDFNAKVMVNLSERNQLAVMHYQGRDDLDLFRDRNNDGNGFLTTFTAGNSSQSLVWTHKNGSRWESSLMLVRTAYQYNIANAFEDNRVVAFSDIEDFGARYSISHQASNGGFVKAGIDWTRHDVSPSIVNSTGTISEIFTSSASSGRYSNELAPYILHERNIGKRLLINFGLRTSIASVSRQTYVYPEPRVSTRVQLDDNQSIKISYSRMIQSIHRVSNSAVTSPTDIWFPVTDSVAPQRSHQFSAAWHISFPEKQILVTVETYYKDMKNLIGFQEGTNLFFNTDFETKLVQGRGKSYGLEVHVRKQSGKLTGWLSYTLARSIRQFDEINGGRWYPSRYDRRHNGALVAQYELNKRWYVSAVWEFISGAKFTPVVGKYIISTPTSTGVDLLPVFAPINSVKLSDSHRLDVGLKFKSKRDLRFQYEWFAGVYNLYNRSNPVGITLEANQDGSLRYEQPGIFGFLPFISYKFKIR